MADWTTGPSNAMEPTALDRAIARHTHALWGQRGPQMEADWHRHYAERYGAVAREAATDLFRRWRLGYGEPEVATMGRAPESTDFLEQPIAQRTQELWQQRGPQIRNEWTTRRGPQVAAEWADMTREEGAGIAPGTRDAERESDYQSFVRVQWDEFCAQKYGAVATEAATSVLRQSGLSPGTEPSTPATATTYVQHADGVTNVVANVQPGARVIQVDGDVHGGIHFTDDEVKPRQFFKPRGTSRDNRGR